MNCPNCKAVGTLRVIRAAALGFPVYVGCEAPGCFWNQEPLPELVIEAAVASWHRANPTPRKPIDHDYEDSGFEDGECFAVVDEDPDSVTRCRHLESEHARVENSPAA